MAGVLATGEIWLAVPETIEIEWSGGSRRAWSPRTSCLFLCAQARHGGRPTQAVHFRGEAHSRARQRRSA
jgi:3-isopropylmalate/(R)-2-methylmalate dehydratase large subunit